MIKTYNTLDVKIVMNEAFKLISKDLRDKGGCFICLIDLERFVNTKDFLDKIKIAICFQLLQAFEANGFNFDKIAKAIKMTGIMCKHCFNKYNKKLGLANGKTYVGDLNALFQMYMTFVKTGKGEKKDYVDQKGFLAPDENMSNLQYMTYIINTILEKSFENLGIECMQFRFSDNRYVEIYLTDAEENKQVEEAFGNVCSNENYPTKSGKIGLTFIKDSDVKTVEVKTEAKTAVKSAPDVKHTPISKLSPVKKEVSYSVVASNTVQNKAVVTTSHYNLRSKILDELMPMICENKSECKKLLEIKTTMSNVYTSGSDISVEKAKWDRFIKDLGLYLAVVDNANAKDYIKDMLKEAVSVSFKKLY